RAPATASRRSLAGTRRWGCRGVASSCTTHASLYRRTSRVYTALQHRYPRASHRPCCWGERSSAWVREGRERSWGACGSLRPRRVTPGKDGRVHDRGAPRPLHVWPREHACTEGGPTMAHPDAQPAADAGPISTGFLEDGRPRARSRTAPTTIAPLGYLTPQEAFGDVERGNPLPYTLPPAQRR